MSRMGRIGATLLVLGLAPALALAHGVSSSDQALLAGGDLAAYVWVGADACGQV